MPPARATASGRGRRPAARKKASGKVAAPTVAPRKKVAAKASGKVAAKASGKVAAKASGKVAAKATGRVSTHPPKPRTPTIETVIARCRAICTALPDVAEVEAWAEPTWRVRGKQFAMFDTFHHGSPHLSLWIPAAPGAQAALIDAEPARFWRPPYVGHRGWVAIVVDDDPPWDMIASLVADAHRLIADTVRRRS